LKLPPWIVSERAGDVALYGQYPDYDVKREAVLTASDYYLCDSEHDAEQARASVFNGTVLAMADTRLRFDPSFFGRDRMRRVRQPGPISERRLIALNGYQNAEGRALVGLRAIERCADVLQGYRVGVFYAGVPTMAIEDVRMAARLFSDATRLPVEIEPVAGWPPEQALSLLGGARISIGLSLDDATISATLEAMIMGAFPIQSKTGSAAEWIRDGETGLLVPPEDPEHVEVAIRRALTDDTLVDGAAERNIWLIADLMLPRPFRHHVLAMYEQVAAEGPP
jgi:glycosyltransferase involved in cell wall biosynthesis